MRAQINTNIRETDEKIKRIDSPPNISTSNFSFSLLSKYNSQQKETTQKRDDVSDESTEGSNNILSLSLFLPYFFMFLYTNTPAV